MTARKRSKELQKAATQKILEEVHRVLYCDTDWDEHEIYGQRFKKIVERSNLDDRYVSVSDDVAKEYRARVEGKLKGTEALNKSLVFYKILTALNLQPMNRNMIFSEMENHSTECISINLSYLEKSGLIERSSDEYRLSYSSKKLLLKPK